MKKIKNLIKVFESDYTNYLQEQNHIIRAEIATELSDSAIQIVHITYDYVNNFNLKSLSLEDRVNIFCNMMHALKSSQEYYGFNTALHFVKNVIEIFERKETP